MNEVRSWLPHLQDSIPPEAQGYTVSLYSVALEGWRRGLTLKFINEGRSRSHTTYFLSYKGVERRFAVSRGDAVPKKAISICINKHLTKKHLLKAEVPTPNGETFGKYNQDI